MELANPSELSFIKFLALDDVFSRYDFIKKEIAQEAFKHFKFQLRASMATRGLNEHQVGISAIDIDPRGVLPVYALRSAHIEALAAPLRYEVGGFGPISAIEVHFSKSLERMIVPAAENLVASIEQFHKLFARKFIELHEKRQSALIRDILTLVLAVCDDDEEALVKQHCRLSVTLPKSQCFSFHISGLQLETFMGIITRRKARLGIDPVLALGTLLYGEDQDYFFEAFRKGARGFLHANFTETEAASINGIMPQIERLIAQSPSLACIELCVVDDFSLQFTTAPKYQAMLESIIARCGPTLCAQFTTNLSRHREGSSRIEGEAKARLAMFLVQGQAILRGFTAKAVTEQGIAGLISALLHTGP